VDEFQNFVTDAFAGILSEARKYRLNLTVAHQYTAQLVVEKSSAVRDAVFGNVGTMIVFRVGSDDAEFLESEFDPEFTPQDIVNLPNYKVYMKLMIDGVTSRPFSAKTLPPMVKSNNKEIEEEVIKSSRTLYCKSKESVEREINNWSGMSLGNDADSGSGNIEKFPVICSLCKKETTVPFKPDPSRTVYCKDCIAKIKSGEVKVEKDSENQIKHDESTFFKPLADLGIEFKTKNKKNGEDDRYPERIEKHAVSSKSPQLKSKFSSPKNNLSHLVDKPGILGTIKKVFHLKDKPKENLALREVLNKVTTKPQFKADQTPALAEVSLDALKNKKSTPSRDRAASPESMTKLKDLISKKISTHSASIPPPPSLPSSASVSPKSIKEVPEDVLRKILE